jgi:hypothetical protein
MNIKQIETSNATCAFLPRSLAPVSAWFQGSALPTAAAAFVSISGGDKRRMAIDPHTYRIRTLLI